MIKNSCVVLICLFSSFVFSQDTTLYSLDFNNVTYKSALVTLEENTDFDFFYIEDWFTNETITKTYSEKSLDFILSDLLSEKNINYYIYNQRVILTKNVTIYDDLVNLNQADSLPKSNTNQIVFSNEFDASNIITIGKQTTTNSKTSFKLSGTIYDLQTNKPVENVVISLDKSSIRTTSNQRGYYEILLPQGYNSLKTQLFGYTSEVKHLIIYGDGTLDFKIYESTEFLDEVSLSASKNNTIKQAKSGITIIDVEESKNIPVVLGERDLLKVSTTLPGITTAGEGAAGYNVRGGRADQNLILLDDAIIYNPSHFLGFFSAINPFATGSVEIYKASIPAEFGGRLSSVFDIKTKPANFNTFTGEGAIGPVTSNLTLQTPIIKDKLAVTGAIRATYSDWILKSLDEESLKNSEASFYDGLIKFNYKIDSLNTIQATGYYSKDKFSLTSDSIFKYSNAIASFKWDHQFRNDKHKLELIVANSQYKYNVNYEANSNRNFDFNYQLNEHELKANLFYKLNKKHHLNYGVSTKLYNVNPGNISPIGSNSIVSPNQIQNERGLESAIFVSDIFDISKKLQLDAGFRFSTFSALGERTQNVYADKKPKNNSNIIETREFDKNETIKSYGGLETRLSLRYLLTPTLSVKTSYNSTIQYIHLLSSNTTISPTDSWKLSDFNIKPQRAQQVSLGVFKNLEGSKLELSLEGYYKRSKDILDYKVGADLLLNENIEQEVLQGEGKAYGIEFLMKKDLGKLNGWFGYSYSRSFIKLNSDIETETVNDGEYFPANFDKPHDFSLVLNYKITKRYSISSNLIYQTGRPITYPVGKYIFNNSEQILYSDRNAYRIPDYFRLDLGVNIEGNHKLKKLAHSFWNISVYNVLGRNNPYSVYFVNEDGAVKAFQTSIFSIPVPTVTYNFKF